MSKFRYKTLTNKNSNKIHVIEFSQQPTSYHRKDSFWFDGDIGTTAKGIAIEGNVKRVRTFGIYASGHIEVTFKPNGKTFSNADAVKEAKALGLGDKALNKLNDHDGWGNNNWFSIYEVMSDNTLKFFDDTAIDFDEAVQMLMDVAERETK